MPTNVTESSTFTTTIQVPNNAEPATQASLLGTFVQGLTNRTKFLTDANTTQTANIDQLFSMQASHGVYSMAGTTLALDAEIPLTAVYNPFALYTLTGGDHISVPYNGFYEVHVEAIILLSSSSNPFSGRIRGKVGSTVFLAAQGKRFSATPADNAPAHGFGLAEISDYTTQSIFFDVEVASGSMDIVHSGTAISQVMLRCVRRT